MYSKIIIENFSKKAKLHIKIYKSINVVFVLLCFIVYILYGENSILPYFWKVTLSLLALTGAIYTMYLRFSILVCPFCKGSFIIGAKPRIGYIPDECPHCKEKIKYK